jgi:hypothetical protein
MAAWSLGNATLCCSKRERVRATSRRLKTGIMRNGASLNRNRGSNTVTTHAVHRHDALNAGSPSLHQHQSAKCYMTTGTKETRAPQAALKELLATEWGSRTWERLWDHRFKYFCCTLEKEETSRNMTDCMSITCIKQPSLYVWGACLPACVIGNSDECGGLCRRVKWIVTLLAAEKDRNWEKILKGILSGRKEDEFSYRVCVCVGFTVNLILYKVAWYLRLVRS